jgi:hypothetical protein
MGQLENCSRAEAEPERNAGGGSMKAEEAKVIPGRVVEPIGRVATDRPASGMVRSSAEHDSEAKTGQRGADAPVDVFEGKEILFVQETNSFESSAVEHENRARERGDGNNAFFVARDLPVAFKSYAAPAQVDAHASRLDSAVLLTKDHRPDRRKCGILDGGGEEPEAIGLQHRVAVEEEQSVTALREKLLQSPVHPSGETSVLR